ncbi:hypothetical protein H2202_004308 [Exophiala xenobiotica]|nr:hypothetical protein H2202_004308 [Exophiala xenobiotica]
MTEHGQDLNAPGREIPFAHMRVHFEDFATQLRLHRHQEHRKRMLFHRRDRLRNAVALSSRLQRVGSWLHDGLVAISRQSDANGFSRVHQHVQDLADSCFSQWTHEITAHDAIATAKLPLKESFMSKLPVPCQGDCIELIQTLRSNPRFLVERFRAMSPAQISALSTFPKYQELSESVLTSLSQNRGKGSQKRRIKAYSKGLEDYATSFERTNPLAFLIHNVYGPFQPIQSKESRLRFATWSTICSTLMVESEQGFRALIGQLLGGFANMYDWEIKPRLELYLMSILQRGAFLLDMVENPVATFQSEVKLFDPLGTQEAQKFFQEAVQELFEILACDGGLPLGALALGRAIIGKLPTVELQSQFRGHFFFQWFLHDFLGVVIAYPEDEKLLHQFHVSDKARTYLLHTIWNRASAQAREVFNPARSEPIDQSIESCVLTMISKLDADDQCFDPYKTATSPTAPSCAAFLSICAADIVHILEALSPQYIHTSSPWDTFLSSSHSTFSMQYGRASSRFDKLRRRILDVIEPGHSSKNIHPCQESWASILVWAEGSLSIPAPESSDRLPAGMASLGHLDLAEQAAIRLIAEDPSPADQRRPGPTPVERARGASLSKMFTDEARSALIGTDSITSMYWQDALSYLRRHYPLAVLSDDDTVILGPMTGRLKVGQVKLGDECLCIEQEVAQLEASYEIARSKVSHLSSWLEKLRVKLWYRMYVVSSDAYDDAKNISAALNNMALGVLQRSAPVSGGEQPREASRLGTPGTSTSSLFEQPRVDAMSILKAPVEHGGPKKLSDSQIEMTKKWLERTHLDNFCKGEERIHRFCMEVNMAVRKLVGETLSESPVLWSNELFSREKNLYDVHAAGLFSVQPSTRAPSVWSEPLSSTSFPSRSGFGGSRASFYSQASGKLSSDFASLISSPGRAATVTTLESGSGFWSDPHSNPRSVTSISSQSRPGSTFEDLGLNRLTDHSQEKAAFLENLQHDLTCLLLSDLACPVWSCGSETDAWMGTILQTASIVDRIGQRSVMARLLSSRDSQTRSKPNVQSKRTKNRRSHSTSPGSHQSPTGTFGMPADPIEVLLNNERAELEPSGFTYRHAFDDVLMRISEHVDPNLKLEAIHDFLILSKACQQKQPNPSEEQPVAQTSSGTPRRQSLNPSLLSSSLSRREQATTGSTTGTSLGGNSESDVVQSLKRLLLVLRPRTIFRDLQYVAAFVSSDTLNDTEVGRAFLHVGLAALAWKDEVCRAMVDVADRIVARDTIKRSIRHGERNEPSIFKAAEYWVVAAREGNPIAQRELASLYLTHPEVPPITSLPLALSSEIFKNDMMWEEQEETQRGRQALCLALHWMQQAAENGDELAKMKLQERQSGRSVR